jgi:hypothetical protein
MNIERVERKLREAKFFLNKMIEEERGAFGDKEQFGFYLSAFLSAAMGVRGAFHSEQDRKWKKAWEDNLTLEEKRLYYFMREDRCDEV